MINQFGIPRFCDNLMVNPILVNWNRNVFRTIPPFFGLGRGIMEPNCGITYEKWAEIKEKYPYVDTGWTQATFGVFEVNECFYTTASSVLNAPTYL